jgi:oxygen-independent coproporphyrinogen-3 oxidase
VERSVVSRRAENDFSLYVAIPFCPTRCQYCSFVSHSVEQAKKLIPDYLLTLRREIRETGKIAAELGLKLKTVYFGGGTPTVLRPEQLAGLFDEVRESFDLSNCVEYTVEAGRADTITPEKLAVIQKAGVTRISINPRALRTVSLKESAANTRRLR